MGIYLRYIQYLPNSIFLHSCDTGSIITFSEKVKKTTIQNIKNYLLPFERAFKTELINVFALMSNKNVFYLK